MKTIRRFEIVELDEFTGGGATIYSIALDDNEETLFDQFLEETTDQFPNETKFLVRRIQAIAKLGARHNYFRPKSEGKFGTGDGVEALYDEPDVNLRLYCIKFGSIAIILGGGGYKPKDIGPFQEDPKLKAENYLLRELSLQINRAIGDGEIWWEGNRLVGRLIFGEDDDEA